MNHFKQQISKLKIENGKIRQLEIENAKKLEVQNKKLKELEAENRKLKIGQTWSEETVNGDLTFGKIRTVQAKFWDINRSNEWFKTPDGHWKDWMSLFN